MHNKHYTKRALAVLAVGAILVVALVVGAGLAHDDWTQPERDEQANAEFEASRQICAGYAFMLIIVCLIVMPWVYRRGRYGG